MIETKQPTVEELAKELNLKQKAFCDYYVTPGEFYGNGVQSYLEAYGRDMEYKVAAILASQLLNNPKIFNYINAQLETGGFNDQNVDKQHLFLINQQADLRTKMSAIDSYNKLKRRVENKLEVTLPKPLLDAVSNNNSNQKDSILEQKD